MTSKLYPVKKKPQNRPITIVCDLSWVLLHPKDRTYTGSLNGLNRKYGGEDGMGKYPFFDHFVLNAELLKYFKGIKDRAKIPIYIFTTDTIQERPEIQDQLSDVFDQIISGKKISHIADSANHLDDVKTNPASYQHISQQIDQIPSDILFIDDKQANLDAAQTSRFQTEQYPRSGTMKESNQAIIARLNAIFGESA